LETKSKRNLWGDLIEDHRSDFFLGRTNGNQSDLSFF